MSSSKGKEDRIAALREAAQKQLAGESGNSISLILCWTGKWLVKTFFHSSSISIGWLNVRR
jgi:hypothetical protein